MNTRPATFRMRAPYADVHHGCTWSQRSEGMPNYDAFAFADQSSAEAVGVSTGAGVAILLVAALHAYFLVLEMFLWNTPFGRRVFRLTPEFSAASRVLAANQGLYNGFLSAGLIWGVSASSSAIVTFFLICVVVAGLFGAATVNRRVFWIQAAPALVALALLRLS